MMQSLFPGLYAFVQRQSTPPAGSSPIGSLRGSSAPAAPAGGINMGGEMRRAMRLTDSGSPTLDQLREQLARMRFFKQNRGMPASREDIAASYGISGSPLVSATPGQNTFLGDPQSQPFPGAGQMAPSGSAAPGPAPGMPPVPGAVWNGVQWVVRTPRGTFQVVG